MGASARASPACLYRRVRFVAFSLLLHCMTSGLVQAQGYVYEQDLARFHIAAFNPDPTAPPTNADGLHAGGELVQTSDGTFFGVAFDGGANGSGAVFSYKTGDPSPTAIYSFGELQGSAATGIQTNGDGANPLGGLTVGRDGNFYGTTSAGGATGSGTIFRITPAGVLTTLYTFSATNANQNADGRMPEGKLVQVADGSFFGNAVLGGAFGAGTLFKITEAGAFTLEYTFPALDANNSNATGSWPAAGLLLANDGNMYGAARYGGANGLGTIFSLSQQGVFQLLHTFSASPLASNADGGSPTAGLMQARDGNLYGTSIVGGSENYGTIFRIGTGGVFSTLYSFNSNSQGADPFDGYGTTGPLIEGPDGTLYGTTYQGGAASGTVFGISPTGAYSLMFSFGSDSGSSVNPSGGLIIGADGNLYGVTAGVNSLSNIVPGSIYMLRTQSTPPLTLTLSPSTVYLGQDFTVTWSSAPNSLCQGFAYPGADTNFIASSGSVTLQAPDFARPLAYFFWCDNPLLGEATTIAVETFLTPAPEVTVAIAPTTISLGNSATVTWTSTNDADCTASGAWSGSLVQNASQPVTPTALGENIYTVSCKNLGGTASASASLTVTAAEKPTITMNITPSEIAAVTGTSTISWTSTGAPNCQASGAWSGSLAAIGTLLLTNVAAGQYLYTLTCMGPAGSTTASVALKVDAPGRSGGGGIVSPLMLAILAAHLLLRARRELPVGGVQAR